jgi:ABC-type multidrug transport system ATPase subunit
MLGLIRTLSQEESISVLLCSHLLHQVQDVCDRIGILNQGRFIAQGTMDELASEGLEAQGERLNLEAIYMRYFQEA